MCKQNNAFAWCPEEQGSLRTDFFPPIKIPTIPHTPWVQKNIPIPPGIYDEVCKIIKSKIDSGVYEPSDLSYRSWWFCVVKKDGTSLRIVHSLEPLNAVTIRHSGVPPFPDHVAELFAGRACGGVLDLFVGYNARLIGSNSRDLTTFNTPFDSLRLTSLPMGWTNSVPVFHDDVTFILQPKIPDYTVPYIDNMAIKGPVLRYLSEDGSYETITWNPGIQHFVWEHFENLNQIVQRMKYAGGTFSGYKSTVCTPEITILGHMCTPEGRIPDPSWMDKIINWGPCKTLSEVRAFLSTIGVAQIFFWNFSQHAHPLIMLTRQNVTFEFSEAQIKAQDDLKAALLASPALRPIDYTSPSPVILAVDTSFIAVRFHLCQISPDNPVYATMLDSAPLHSTIENHDSHKPS